MTEKLKCLIIGSGPAGYTAGIYASRAGLNPVIIAGYQPGGQLTLPEKVDNFPGYPEGKSGLGIMEDLREQASRLGTDIRRGLVNKVDLSKRPFVCTIDDGTVIEAETLIIATGATARWLGMESETKYRGFGVSTCATCDGAFFKGKDVAVIGGGDTALEDALYLSKICRKVFIIHRRDALRGSHSYQQRVFNTPNIEVIWNSIPKEILGEQSGFIKKVTGLMITNKIDNSESVIPVDGIFIAIGITPETELFKCQLDLDDQGYIITIPGTPMTAIPGVFAAGDVQDPNYRQAITAAASGCTAAIEAARFLS